MSGAVWWSRRAMIGYLGHAELDGLQWSRHTSQCRPGFWRVSVTGWPGMSQAAVVDDFGNLVQVPA